MFIEFKRDISNLQVPELLNYPFYSDTSQLAKIAILELQTYIEKNQWEHNFGFKKDGLPIGKMFGVLVVQNSKNQIGYLCAYSGTLQGINPDQFFVKSIKNNLSSHLKNLSNDKELVKKISFQIKEYERDVKGQASLISSYKEELSLFRQEMIQAKQVRKLKRKKALSPEEEQKLIKESLHYKYLLRRLKQKGDKTYAPVHALEKKIETLKLERKKILQDVQLRDFQAYKFLNGNSEIQSLADLFKELPYSPPPGSGECAAPKLFQYAFKNNLKPISLAEFWWGSPPKGEVRQHKNIYPSCSSRCGPILTFMLKGLEVEPNPMLQNEARNKKVEIIFEDKELIIINKPEGLLSVPGKSIKDSVASRFSQYHIIHRLDQETSGLMILAKNKLAQRKIQKQFIEKKVLKTYIAILTNNLEKDSGEITLALTLDFNNRPRQKVCDKSGKSSFTLYKVLKRKSNESLVQFHPQTGRTHQLRVHSAHFKGLNSPIKGDTLYGIKDKRLYLHAKEIEFIHPQTKRRVKFSSECKFELLF